ncbi:MAG: DNA mismatch repair endonuclease MutL [Candidatus Eremiobacteraeota bacterium]|nr:DNA mismatch repair endonuclease MutL [Candidatus Eremiobacteraeota bacterium]
MPSRIRQLDATTIAQIAAGEVIERPVSVVKELVENSLDAGASTIAVEVVDGGRVSIGVSDNGSGILRDDVALAFARHATSKLSSARDLFAVDTLGFRGEGLASIAAAAHVELTSRAPGAELGARIDAHGMHVGTAAMCAAPPGTKVVVRDLFADMPARREFMKSARAEFARISAFLGRLSLGWPEVAFRLTHDGKEIWSLPAVHDGVERLEMVFGNGSRGALRELAPDGAPARVIVSGYVSSPGHDKPNREGQIFFVNGRLIRNAQLGAAWLAGSGSFGITGRYPFGMLALELPPEDVDVNVHPTKIEVRFARGHEIFDAVRTAVARTLRLTEVARPAPPIAFAPSASAGHAAELPALAFAPRSDAAPGMQADAAVAVAPSGSARIYGQVDRTFIVAGDAQGLFIIDQHAAHERIAYEALLEHAGDSDASAPLLFPTIVELSDDQAAALYEHVDELAAAGVVVEPFGEGAYRISALPAGYEKRRFDLAGILDDLSADDAAREGIAHRNRLLATIACHSVVRAHEALSLQEQSALYDRLQRCDDPHTCPHGRPTMLRLDAASLAKAFGRA